jgi:hypothetical protein
MEGTVNLELEPLLRLEMAFEFTPGRSDRLNCHPDLAEQGYGPDYDFQEIKVWHQDQWHTVPDWLFELFNRQFEMDLVEIVDQWVTDHPRRNPRRRPYGTRKYRRGF